MSAEKFELEARLVAIEYLVAKMLTVITHGVTDDQFDVLIENYRDGMDAQTIPGIDAAQSDLISAEIRDALVRLLKLAKELRQGN